MTRVWLACGLAGLLAFAGCGGEKPAAPVAESGTSTPADDSVDLGTPAAGETAAAPAGTASNETPPVPEPPAPAPSSSATPPAVAAVPAGNSGSVDLSHLTDQGALALVIRPSRALGNPVVQGVIRSVEEVNPEFKFADRLEEMKSQFGVEINDIDHVLVVVDQQQLAMALMFGSMFMGGGGPPGGFDAPPPAAFDGVPPDDNNCDDQPPALDAFQLEEGDDPFAVPPPTVVFQFNKEVNQEQLAGAGDTPAEAKTHGGKTYYVKPDKSAAWFQTPTTAIITTEKSIISLIDGQAATPGPLAPVLAPLAEREFALILDVKPLHDFVGQVAQQNPIAGMVGGLVKQVNTLTLAADLQGSNLLQVQLHTLNEGSAGGLEGMLGGFLQQGKNEFIKTATDNPEFLGPDSAELGQVVGRLVDGASVTSEGSICSITIPRPEGIEKLPEIIKPLLQKSFEQAKAQQELNNLRQIAIAFHIYHDIYQGFPAHGGPFDADAPGKGLSWRVHLLPFLEEAELYSQFNLEEAWDSEHNLKLVPQMPALFGKNPEGKSSLHVFVGEGAPFHGEQGLRIREVTDGTSNTLLIVEAGPSAADIWTKPGGLTFNRENPIAALGDVGETIRLSMMDGSVRTLPASLDAATLANLIQHADGNVVDLP